MALSALGSPGGRYLVAFTDGTSDTVIDDEVIVGPGGARRLRLRLPSAGPGRVVVRDPTGVPVAGAPVVPSRPARTPGDALGIPEISADARLAEVRVRLGILRREDGRVRSVRVHGVRLALVPEAGGDALAVTGAKQDGAWAAGTYRFLVARRLASGLEVPSGRYRRRRAASRERALHPRLTRCTCGSLVKGRNLSKLSQSPVEGIRIDGY